MRKHFLLFIACLLLCAQTTAALANGWGLTGGVYDIVADEKDYGAYSAEAETGNRKVHGRHVDVALLSSRYHSQLIVAVREDKTWRMEVASTAAVYQPGDERGVSPELTYTEGGFCLTYDGRETYTFADVDGRYFLQEVRFNAASNYGDSLLWDGDGYLYWEAGQAGSQQPIGDAYWQVERIDLADFCIAQLPRSMDDVRRMNDVYKALREAADEVSVQEDWDGVKDSRKLAVYSAPDAASYRASSGKAAVSTGGEMKLLGEYGGWTMVEYAVSLRTSRIGFVQERLMSEAEALVVAQPGVNLVTARDAFLTDDPHVSQYPQMTIPAGTPVQGLACLNDFYALVSYEGASQPVWGFVPLRDLSLPSDGTRWDVMNRLVGKWRHAGGAEQGANLRVFYSDGSYHAITKDEDFNWVGDAYGQWRVTDCPADADYAEKALYEIVFTMDDGAETRYGLLLNEDGSISLMEPDGGAWYERNEYSTFGNG